MWPQIPWVGHTVPNARHFPQIAWLAHHWVAHGVGPLTSGKGAASINAPLPPSRMAHREMPPHARHAMAMWLWWEPNAPIVRIHLFHIIILEMETAMQFAPPAPSRKGWYVSTGLAWKMGPFTTPPQAPASPVIISHAWIVAWAPTSALTSAASRATSSH